MGVIKVETFDVDVTATASQTHTLTNDVGSLSSAFVRRTTSIDKQSGPVGSTGNANPNIVSGAAFLSGTNEISFRQNTTTSQKIVGEVWRYTGAASGPDEFIVRDRLAITITGNTASQAVSGIVDVNKCIPFWTGSTNTNTSVNDYDASTVSVYIDGSNNIQIERGSNTGTLVVYVTVVEFTGANWEIGHVRSASHDGANEVNITIRTSSDATTGIFDVEDWSTAMIIEASLEGDTAETGLSDNLGIWKNGGSTSTASFFNDQDAGTQNDGVSYAHILKHPALNVNRGENTNYGEGNNTYTSVPWPVGAPTTVALDELSLEWFSDTSGTGTAHARGRLSAYITSGTGSITTWVHRSGNNVRINYGAVDLSAVNGTAFLSVTDVDGDEILNNTQTGVVISGLLFEAVQGTGTVELVENSDYSGTIVSQTVTNWSDSSITIDFNAGSLSDSNSFIFVTTDSGSRGFISVQVGIPPLTYQDAVLSLAPDHHWPFDGNFNDIAGVLTRNAFTNIGIPGFTTTPLTRGRTQSFTITGQGQRIEIADSTLMNLAALPTRSMGGWIRFDQVQDSFVCWYEEGGGVNNLAFFMGIGGILIAQLADTGDDNVHAYSNFKLEPNRNYHIMFRFDYNGTDRFELLVDGVLQDSTFGNPLVSAGNHLDAHSGDVGWGSAEGTLEVFGTDITFPAPVISYYQDWHTWTTFLTDSQIRTTLFEQGVRGDIQITSGTQAAMQAQLDAYADTVQPNSDCTFRIADCTDGDFTLDFDNITFNEGTTLHIQYLGDNILTANNLNGSNLDSNKISTLNLGTVNIVTPSTLTVSGLQSNTEVRVFEAGTTTEVAGIETTSGDWVTSLQTNSVDISVINLNFQNIRLKAVNTSSDAFVPVVQRVDRQYLNP